jgi:hypothetical protein
MRQVFLTMIFAIGIVMLMSPENSYAQCTPRDRIDLGKQGYTREEVNEICGEARSHRQTPRSNSPNEQQPYQAPPPLAAFCCDLYGVRRCMMNPLLGSTPVGGPCFCYGQGQGIGCP